MVGHTLVCLYVCNKCLYTHVCMKAYGYTHIYIHIYTYAHIYTHIHTYIPTYIHIHIHAYTHIYTDGGPHFDNDKMYIEDITIAPTFQEILSREGGAQPYMPKNGVFHTCIHACYAF